MVFLGILIFGWSTSAAAQTGADRFKYQVTPYLWLSGLDGTVGARGRTANVDASAGDILDHLDFAAMGTFDARWNRWRLLVDTLYVNVSGEKGTPDPFAIDARVSPRAFIFDPEVGYQILRREGVDLDVMGGLRVWHLKNQLQLTQNTSQIDFEHTKSWPDPIVGLRFTSDLPKRFYVTAKADIGGFDAAARIDWQAFGGLGFKFNDRIVGVAGYRHLAVDYKNEGFVYDTALKGIIAGVGLRF
jgi:hypothetical protein